MVHTGPDMPLEMFMAAEVTFAMRAGPRLYPATWSALQGLCIWRWIHISMTLYN